eukprot:comp20797_c0_seq1/m.27355 comp20797_c0_seq1/g.27355  ORF comp20797_c0_seq1/g.27355 comp20797_c0_seq1/m.27355 type:complete len:423 (-) comp20797_c0_seq1:185-1453(-)
MEDKEEKRVWVLDKEHEFRMEVGFDRTVTVTLVDGMAEVFGSEMAQTKAYSFCGKKVGIFTWSGCRLEVRGTPGITYVSDSTPMLAYINTHMALEQRRAAAEKNKTPGPRAMVVGAPDVGKSTVAQILLNYAARCSHRPLFVDLDVGQGAIAVPGMVGALQLERPTAIEEGITATAPLIYHYGHTSPSENPALFKRLVSRLAQTTQKRCDVDEKVRTAGYVINTCGWVDSQQGVGLLRHTIDQFQASVVLVLDHERLYNDLKGWCKEHAPRAEVVKLTKSGGVVARDSAFRQRERNQRIKEYFYGPGGSLCPHSTLVKFDTVKLFKIGAPPVPLSCLPLGVDPAFNETKLTPLPFSDDLVHALVSVSNAEEPTQAVVDTSVVGFVYVSHMDMANKQMTILSPAPGPLPRRILLSGTLRWIEQ